MGKSPQSTHLTKDVVPNSNMECVKNAIKNSLIHQKESKQPMFPQWTQNLNRHFTKEGEHTADKQDAWQHESPGKCQIKHETPTDPSYWVPVRRLATSHAHKGGGNWALSWLVFYNMVQPLWNTRATSQKVKSTATTWPRHSTPGYLPKRGAASFAKAQTWNIPNVHQQVGG